MHRYHLRIIVLVYVLKVRNYFPTSVLLSVWIMICADAFLDNGSSPYTSQWECKKQIEPSRCRRLEEGEVQVRRRSTAGSGKCSFLLGTFPLRFEI